MRRSSRQRSETLPVEPVRIEPGPSIGGTPLGGQPLDGSPVEPSPPDPESSLRINRGSSEGRTALITLLAVAGTAAVVLVASQAASSEKSPEAVVERHLELTNIELDCDAITELWVDREEAEEEYLWGCVQREYFIEDVEHDDETDEATVVVRYPWQEEHEFEAVDQLEVYNLELTDGHWRIAGIQWDQEPVEDDEDY